MPETRRAAVVRTVTALTWGARARRFAPAYHRAVFRVLELREGRVELFEGSERVGPPPDGVVRWIDLSGVDAALEVLRERFDFHPLTIEDCSHLDQRPKLEEYRDHVFLVTQGFAAAGDKVHALELQ
jgi:magnesium transporter